MIFQKGKKKEKLNLDKEEKIADKWVGDGGNKRTKERQDTMIFCIMLILYSVSHLHQM